MIILELRVQITITRSRGCGHGHFPYFIYALEGLSDIGFLSAEQQLRDSHPPKSIVLIRLRYNASCFSGLWLPSVSGSLTMPSNFASADPIQAHRDMTKRDLWKLDCHILPALALVSTSSVEIYHY